MHLSSKEVAEMKASIETKTAASANFEQQVKSLNVKAGAYLLEIGALLEAVESY